MNGEPTMIGSRPLFTISPSDLCKKCRPRGASAMPERVCIPAEGSRLSAGHAHMAGDGRTLVAAIDDEVVPLGLAADRLVNRSHEQVVGLRRTQWFAQIGRVFLAETHIKRAGAGHPYAIAGFAEIMRQRSNET